MCYIKDVTNNDISKNIEFINNMILDSFLCMIKVPNSVQIKFMEFKPEASNVSILLETMNNYINFINSHENWGIKCSIEYIDKEYREIFMQNIPQIVVNKEEK